MKNIEKYFDEFYEGLMCEPYEREKNIKLECEDIPCSECPYKKIIIDWLLEEYQMPVELTRFEYDLLKIYESDKDFSFNHFDVLKHMKQKGYFNDIEDDMKLIDIFVNYKVI